MALKKLITTPSDFVAEYLRIDALYYNRAENVTEIVVGLYRDKVASDAGAKPITQMPVKIDGESNEVAIAAIHDLVAPIAYGALRQVPDFADAVDV